MNSPYPPSTHTTAFMEARASANQNPRQLLSAGAAALTSELLFGITNKTTDLICAFDLQSRLIFANPAALTVMGLSEQQALGTTGADRGVTNAEAVLIAGIDCTVLNTGQTLTREEVIAGPAGSRTYLTSKCPMFDAAGTIVGIISISGDITERLALQTQVAQQAKVIAGESLPKDEFLTMLGHELRGFLAPVGFALHLLKTDTKSQLSPATKQAIGIIERQTANLSRLVSDLLEVPRAPSGRISAERQPISLAAESSPTQPRATAAAAPPNGLRILVVDDNIDLVTMLVGTLRQRGYSTQYSYSGPDALMIAASWQPDIVLLDIGLPGIDGYEVARRLRASQHHLPSNNRMGLVALTGYGSKSDILMAKQAGFNAHMTKPAEFEAVEAMIRKIVAARFAEPIFFHADSLSSSHSP